MFFHGKMMFLRACRHYIINANSDKPDLMVYWLENWHQFINWQAYVILKLIISKIMTGIPQVSFIVILVDLSCSCFW